MDKATFVIWVWQGQIKYVTGLSFRDGLLYAGKLDAAWRFGSAAAAATFIEAHRELREKARLGEVGVSDLDARFAA